MLSRAIFSNSRTVPRTSSTSTPGGQSFRLRKRPPSRKAFRINGNPCSTFSTVMSGGQPGMVAAPPRDRRSSRKRFLVSDHPGAPGPGPRAREMGRSHPGPGGSLEDHRPSFLASGSLILLQAATVKGKAPTSRGVLPSICLSASASPNASYLANSFLKRRCSAPPWAAGCVTPSSAGASIRR